MVSRIPVREHKLVKQTIAAAGEERVLDALPDVPDIRDRTYEPSLLRLRSALMPPNEEQSPILDQGREGACTGFALAAAVNLLNRKRHQEAALEEPGRVSPRMLYEMARIHDEWPGENYSGSSVRGAIKGFFHNGVCSEVTAPYRFGDNSWSLTASQAKEARNIGLGAYYRLRPEMIDYHAALNETGVVVASANTHRGWRKPRDGRIIFNASNEGGHAFAIVGYDDSGFLIQNSWGLDWGGFEGQGGIAHWPYEDWSKNIIDAWVLRLSVPTPKSFHLTNQRRMKALALGQEKSFLLPEPRRADVLGHVIHIDDGELVESGRYGTSLASIRETATLLGAQATDTRKYHSIMIYAHGGLNNQAASARRIHGLRDKFKENGIYPIHFMWETGVTEELGDVLGAIFKRSKERVGSLRDGIDWLIERSSRKLGRKIWREIKKDAVRAFKGSAGGTLAMRELITMNAGLSQPYKIHLVGHSAGSILLGELLAAWDRINRDGPKVSIDSCTLMAPACTLDYYDKRYRPALKDGPLKKLIHYNLIDDREQDDTVGPYGKSLLYLVSNAFEEDEEMPLLGMEKFLTKKIKLPPKHSLHYAGRKPKRTDSHTHGGFDNDRDTMNSLLETILGKKPPIKNRFTEEDLEGF